MPTPAGEVPYLEKAVMVLKIVRDTPKEPGSEWRIVSEGVGEFCRQHLPLGLVEVRVAVFEGQMKNRYIARLTKKADRFIQTCDKILDGR